MPCALVLLAKATLRTLEDILSKGRPPTIRGSTALVPRARQRLALKEVSYTHSHRNALFTVLI